MITTIASACSPNMRGSTQPSTTASSAASRRRQTRALVGPSPQRMAELFCRSDQLPASSTLCCPTEKTVASEPSPQVPEGPDQLGRDGPAGRDLLAEADDPTPMAEPTTGRQSDPREEPDALTRTSGSERGAPGNRRPYRDSSSSRCLPTGPRARSGGPTSTGCWWLRWPTPCSRRCAAPHFAGRTLRGRNARRFAFACFASARW